MVLAPEACTVEVAARPLRGGLLWSCLALGCSGDKADTGESCPSWSAPQAVASLSGSPLDEASGLAGSSTLSDILWTHNDDGDDDGVLHAVSTDGTVSGSLTLTGAAPEDWESVAVHNGFIYVGDIGDNDAEREHITILRTQEPSSISSGAEAGVVERFRFTWPDGPRDAEAMLVDPANGRLLVLSRDADRAEVMRLPDLDSATDGEAGAVVASVDLNSGVYAGLGAVRGADVAADGSVVLRLSDGVVWLPGDGRAEAALAGVGCTVPNPSETDGEGVAVSGDSLYFLGEGSDPTLWAVHRGGA